MGLLVGMLVGLLVRSVAWSVMIFTESYTSMVLFDHLLHTLFGLTAVSLYFRQFFLSVTQFNFEIRSLKMASYLHTLRAS